MSEERKAPLQPLPVEWKRRIGREMEPGEKVLWAGQPDPTMAFWRNFHLTGSIFLVVAVLFLGVVLLGWNNMRQENVGTWLAVVLLLLILAGLPCLMLRQRQLAYRTCYVLTSKRALVFLPKFFGKLQVVSYFPQQLQNAKFQSSRFFGPQAGDWVFREHVTKHTTRHFKHGLPAPVREEVSWSVKVFGFLMLREALVIEPLLKKVAQQQ